MCWIFYYLLLFVELIVLIQIKSYLTFCIEEIADYFTTMNRCRRYSSHFARDFRVFDPRSSHGPGSGVSVYGFAVNITPTKIYQVPIKYSDNKQIMLEQSRKKSLYTANK